MVSPGGCVGRRRTWLHIAVVAMTGMRELIALFHSFVGLAALLVGWNGYLEVEARGPTASTTAESGGEGSTPQWRG